MKRKKMVSLFAILCVLFSSDILYSAEEFKWSEPIPALRVAKMTKPPVIDGRINEDEWKSASAITGFRRYMDKTLIPDFLQPVWWLGFDSKNLYLAQRWPQWPKNSFRATCLEGEGQGNFQTADILCDDHVEIQICPFPERGMALNKYFYKIMVNPAGAFSDQRYAHAIGAPGLDWTSGADIKCYTDEDVWEMEMSIPLNNIDLADMQGIKKIFMQLVSTTGAGDYYNAWQPGSWLEWDIFPEIYLDKDAVAFQMARLGDLMEGKLDLKVNMFNGTNKKKTLYLEAEVTDQEGKQLFNKKEEIAISPDKQQKMEWKKDNLGITDLYKPDDYKNYTTINNYFSITVKDNNGNIYYQTRCPFKKLNDFYRKSYLSGLTAAKPPAEPDLSFAYYPYYNKLKAWAGIWQLGLKKETQGAKAFAVQVYKKGEQKELLYETESPVSNKKAEVLINLSPPLDEGKYEITMELLDGNGKIITKKTGEFERKFFPFEHNQLGKSGKVIKPFTPMKVENNAIEFWGRKYSIGNTILPEQIITKSDKLLRSPVTIHGVVDSKDVTMKANNKPVFTKAEGSDVRLVSEGSIGPVSFKAKAHADYDGQYLIRLELSPERPVKIEKLAMQIPLMQPVDTMNAQIIGYGYCGPVPEGEGVVWDSARLPAGALSGTFVPLVYLGNGERGLYWYAETDEGWSLDDEKPAIEIARGKGEIELKVNLVNKPFILNKTRTIQFAFMATPVKPLPKDYRIWEWMLAQWNSGGWWGSKRGLFCLPVTEDEMSAHRDGSKTSRRKLLLDLLPNTITKEHIEEMEKDLTSPIHGWTGDYRAMDLIGYLQPEFKVFCGEWSGKNNPKIVPDSQTHVMQTWPEPEARAFYGKDMCQSSTDFEVYYFYRMAKESGLPGYWWDSNPFTPGASLIKDRAYIRDDGKLQPKYNMFLVRDMWKRMATVLDELNMPNTHAYYAPGIIPLQSFFGGLLAIESCFYLHTQETDMFTQLGVDSVDKYRCAIGKYTGLPVSQHASVYDQKRKTDLFQTRSVLAMALLHDAGAENVNYDELCRVMKTLDKTKYFFLDSTEWIPYWRSSKLVKPADENKKIYITIYRAEDKSKSILVIANADEKEITTNFSIDTARLYNKPEAPKSAGELETGASLNISTDTGRIIIGPITIPRHDFRLVEIVQ